MARRLRFVGTDSKHGGCPALHEDLETGEIIVQGVPLSDALDLEQLQHFTPEESAVVVPRELLVNWGPKEIERVPDIIDQEQFRRLFEAFKHSACTHRQTVSSTFSATRSATPPRERTYAICGVPTQNDCTFPQKTSGSLTPGWSPC